jgi:hypothetical protein
MTWRGVWDGEWDGVWEGGGDPNSTSGTTSFGFTASGTLTTTAAAEPAGATPGYERTYRRRYRVRVGRRWLEVDPLDARSVKAAYAAAEDEAERAAQERVVAPARSAARVVAAKPAEEPPGVDYAALAADARRISEQVRAVYAQALQRELIGRLMRERAERDDEDDIELLMMV